MKYVLHILSVLIIIALFSCNSEKKQQVEKPMMQVAPSERLAGEITPMGKRTIALTISEVYGSIQEFQYKTNVSVKMGELVDAQLSEIAPSSIDFQHQLDTETVTTRSQPADNIGVFPVMVNIIFDNDIFNNTDYYYTNGARMELVLPAAKKSPLNKVLFGLRSKDIDVSGFSVTQNIYTPINPEATEITYGDRPFAAYLTLGQFKESYHLKKKLQIKSALDLGVMGPLSLGEQVQSAVHELEPTGWEYQVQNSFLVNYYVGIEKGVYSSSNIELNIKGETNLGTLYNKVGGGFYFRAGNFLPVYRGPMTLCCNQVKKQQIQYWFFVTGNAELVAYNATLQGSLFNNNSPYVIQSNELNRALFKGSAGIAFYYDNLGLELENFYLTPDFKGAYQFGYGRIKLVANF